MLQKYVSIAAAAVCLLAGAARAQEAPAVPADPTAAGCELHVWPGSDLVYLYYGWAHGGTINGAVKGREGYPTAPENPLTAAVQADLLSAPYVPALVGRAGYKLVVHPEVLSSRTIRSSTTRIADSQSPCYAELMVDDLLLSQNVISGNALRASFRFRDFGAGQQPASQFGSFVITELKLFPAKTPEGVPAAAEELKKAFQSDLGQFAADMLKPHKKKR